MDRTFLDGRIARLTTTKRALLELWAGTLDTAAANQLVAYVVPRNSASASASELRSFLQRRLPMYMVPARFVLVPALPTTTSGKVDRKLLPAVPDEPSNDGQPALAATPCEQRLLRIWSDVLGVEHVGVQDDFFALGGHSLLAVRIVSRIREVFGREISVAALFEAPTVRLLAERIEAGALAESVEIPPAPLEQAAPLSPAQERIWLFEQLHPELAAYNMAGVIQIEGGFDLGVLRATFHLLTLRHASLRTVVFERDGRPLQRVTPHVPIPLELVERCADLDGHTSSAEALLEAFARAPFDLVKGPPIRARIFRLAPERHRLAVVVHHIMADGRSVDVLLKEFVDTYRALRAGLAPRLPALPISYLDYAIWHRERADSGVLQAQLEYWKAQLRSLPTVELPRDRPGPARHADGAVTRELSKECLGELNALASREGVTRFMMLLAAFKVLLSRYARQAEVVVGTQVAGRTVLQTEAVVGCFVNTIVLRTHVSPAASFTQLLGDVRRVVVDANSNAELPFEKVVEAVDTVRDPSRSPLFQIAFAADHVELDSRIVSEGGTSFELSEADTGPAKYELTLSILERSDGSVAAKFIYDASLFDRERMERMARHYTGLLESLVRAPDRRIGDFPLVGEDERDALIGRRNAPRGAHPRDTLHKRFEEQVAKTPERIAVVDGERRLTYRELNEQANQLAHFLRDLGIGPEMLVGVCVERSAEMLVALLGVLKAGGGYLPLDPDYPEERLRFMLDDARVSVVVTTAESQARVSATNVGIVLLAQADLSAKPRSNPTGYAEAQNVVYAIYTSGSTGRPKGVVVRHADVGRLFSSTAHWFNFSENDVWTLFHSYAFDFSVWEIWGALLYGGKLVVVPYIVSRTPERFRALLLEQRVTVLNQTPSAFRQLIAADEEAGGAQFALRTIIFGGEALELASLHPWVQRYGDESPQLVNMFGITETTVHVTYRRITAVDIERAASGAPSPIGVPITDMHVYLLDSTLQLVPEGVVGETFVGGAGVARGYLRRPSLTAERFIPDPFSLESGARMYRTGDLARWTASGELEYLGRADHQVKIRGFRIELGEIEAALLKHPWIREAAASVLDEGGGPRLVAYVAGGVGAPNEHDVEEAAPIAELRAFLAKRLPGHMLPSGYVVLSELPKHPNGKTDRRVLSTLQAQRHDQDRDQSYEAPTNAIEEALARIWHGLLRRSQPVSRNANFFELGGDSILAIQVVAAARNEGIDLSPRLIFEEKTLAAIAASSTPLLRSSDNSSPQVESGSTPLTPIQAKFFAYQRVDRHHFNQAILLEAGKVDEQILEQALGTLVDRHDSLRSTFREEADGWEQTIVARNGRPVLERVPDLSPDTLQRLQANFDLAEGPLFRAAWLAGEPNKLLLVAHHLVVDAVSWRILVQELEVLCTPLRDGTALRLPPKTTSYRDWALRLLDLSRSPEFSGRELAYWRDQAWARASVLPLGKDAPDDTEATAQTLVTGLDARQTGALVQGLRAYRAKVEEALLVALAQAFARRGLSGVLRLDVEGHGREDSSGELDVSMTVGWFTSLYPLLVPLSSEETSWGNRILAVKEACRSVPHGGLGFGALQLSEGARGVLSQIPASSVVFNYLGNIDATSGDRTVFRLAPADTGQSRSLRSARWYALEIDAAIQDGKLSTRFTYGPQLDSTWVDALAHEFVKALTQLSAHSAEPGSGAAAPSDFPLARISRQWLDRFPRRGLELEDLYPLAPMQQGFLLYGLSDAASAIGVERTTFRTRGPLDVPVFIRAWEAVIRRHPVLRTFFVTDDLTQPLQAVAARVALPIKVQDVSDEAEACAIEAALGAALDPGQAPLLRLAVLRVSDDIHRVTWVHHHALLDGWSVPLVLREVEAHYRAFLNKTEPLLPAPKPYRKFVAWLQGRSSSDAETYWRNRLVGLRGPTPLTLDRLARGPMGHAELAVHLPKLATARLVQAAKRQGLTISTILEACWALTLSRYAGRRDVLFGTTVSGRPTSLVGSESMIGMFINVVPTRISVDDESPVHAWLEQLAAQRISAQPHEYLPIAQVQELSEIPPPLELFQSLFVFENYPERHELIASRAFGNVEVDVVDATVRTRYRLTIVAIPDEELAFHAAYDHEHWSDQGVRLLLENLLHVLEQVAASTPATQVQDIELLSSSEREILLKTWSRSPCAEVVIVRDEAGRLSPLGAVGKAYRGDRAWAEAVVRGTSPHLGAETGLLARYELDGALTWLGSPEDVIVINDLHVHRNFVEDAARAVAGVHDFALDTRRTNAGDELVAYVVPGTQQVTDRTRRAAIARLLPDDLVPVAIVNVAEIPRLADGQIDRQLLRGAPPPALTRPARGWRSEMERKLAQIWSDVLRIDEPSSDEDFFALGGQSVAVIQMISRVRDELGLEASLREIFERRTLGSIAEYLEQRVGRAVEGTSVFRRAPLQKAPASQVYDLSPYQYPEFYFSELAPDSPMYNILSCDIMFEGDLDLEAMRLAWQTVQSRHGVFRTTFEYQDGRPVQRVAAPRGVELADIYIDRRDTPPDAFVAESTRLAHEFANKVLDFRNGPMFIVKLAEFPGKRFMFILLTNHVLWDEASSINLSTELREAYSAHRASRTPQLPELELDYVDYASWVNDAVRSGALERERQYWLRRFEDVPDPLELPTDFPRPRDQTFNGSDVSGTIPRDVTQKLLGEFLKQHTEITLSMLLHAVLNLFLYRISGQRDFVVGMPIANRGDKRLEPVIGPFATAMPMRCTIPEHPVTFTDLLNATRLETLEALEHYAYPSVLAIEEINPQWDNSRGRLFSVMYGLQHNKTAFWADLVLEGLSTHRLEHLTNIGPLHSTSRCDLRLIAEELGQDILYSLSFNSDLFKRSTVERFAAEYEFLLRQVVDDPTRGLTDYQLLTATERERVLGLANDTAAAFDSSGAIHTHFEQAAKRCPEAVALDSAEGSWTYRRLDAVSTAYAHQLIRSGVRLENRVGVKMTPSPLMIVAILAVLKAGAAYVPLDPELPDARIRATIEEAEVGIVFTDGPAEYVASARAIPVLPGLAAEGGPTTLPSVRPNNAAVVFYTSGSTGSPKGIVVEHRGIVNVVQSTQEAYRLRAEEATMLNTPFTFDASLLDVFWPLSVGAKIVIPPVESLKSPARLSASIARHGVAVVQFVPLMLDAFVEAAMDQHLEAMPTLRLVICGGAALSSALRDRFRRNFHCALANHYGPTEVTVDAARFDTAAPYEGEVVPIGWPIHNVRMYVLDSSFEPVPFGVNGEIFVSSVGLTRGYLSDPVKTAAHLLPDPFADAPGLRMYRTGDLGRKSEDGTIHFIGRIDRQVKVRGNRVELEEIEVQLNAHPSVERCGVRHRKNGSGADFLEAFVQLRLSAHSVGANERSYRVFTLAQRPEKKRAMDAVHLGAWPAYFEGNAISREYWPQLATTFPSYQVMLTDALDQVLAVGHAVPMKWDGTVEGLPRGWDGGLADAFALHSKAELPDTLLMLAGVVHADYSGRGLSSLLLEAFKRLAKAHGLRRAIVAVRPTDKTSHPELSFEEWCNRKRSDGLPQDRWLRVHERVGGKRLKIDTMSQLVRGDLESWRRWTGGTFASSGSYVVNDTLQPVQVDIEAGTAEYYDPAVWMEHEPAPADSPFVHVGARELKQHLSHLLPAYMEPERIHIVPLLPTTSSGKVDIKRLPEIAFSPEEQAARIPAQTHIQAKLVEIWQEVLKIEHVGIADEFFSMGGHSIRAIEMLARVFAHFDVKVPVREFYADDTIRGLERLIVNPMRSTPDLNGD